MSIVEKALEKLQRKPQQAAAIAMVAAAPPRNVAMPTARSAPVGDSAPATPRPRLKIDRERLQEMGVLPPLPEQRRLASEFRRIKRPLVERALSAVADVSSNASIIMVTSAVPGEGKTFTAMNLALSLALEQDASVLLIDADVLKPRISTVLGIEKRPGLLDALADPAVDAESLVFQSDIPTLCVLAAGTRAENATELLASQRMFDLVAQLRSADTRRIVLLDSPPLLLTTESRELASIAGQIVLAVRAGETPRQAVYDAIALLGDGKQIGVVLNQVEGELGGAVYYGYGGYGTYGDRADGHL